MRSNSRTSGQSDGEPTFTEKARWSQIIRHTIDVVADLGYSRASLNRIAEHTGISKGLISYHFAGKDDLLEALVRDVFRRGTEFVKRERAEDLAPDAPADVALRAYLEGHLAFIAANPRDVGAIVEVARNHRDAAGRLVFGGAWDEGLDGELVRIFKAGQASGAFRRFDPRVMAIAVRRVIDGFAFQLITSPGLDAEAFTAEVVAMFDHATASTERS